MIVYPQRTLDRIKFGSTCLFFVLLCSAVPLVYDPEGYFNFRVPKYLFFSLLVSLQSVAVFLNRKHCQPIRFNALTLAYCLFFLAVGVVQFSAHDQNMSLNSTFERMEGFWFYASLFLFFCLTSLLPPSTPDWKPIFLGWVGISVLVCLLGFGFSHGLPGEQRMASTLGNASSLAHYLLSSLLLLFLAAPSPSGRVGSYLPIAITFLLLTGIFLTFSRTTYIGIFVGGLVFGLVRSPGARVPKMAMIKRTMVWVVPAALLGVSLFYRYHKLLLYLLKTPQSLLDRLRLWQIALSGIKERPLLGWGTDNYTYVYEKYSRFFPFPQTFWYDRSHNVFLEWWVSGGALTGISYVGIWILVLWYIWKASLPRQQKAILTVWWAVSLQYLILNIDNLPNWILLLLISQYLLSHQPADRVKIFTNKRGISLLSYLLLAGGVCIFCMSFWKTATAYTLVREYAVQQGPVDRLALLKQLDATGSAVNYNLVKSASDDTYKVLSGSASEEFKKEFGEAVLHFIENEIKKRPPSLYLLHKKAGLESTLSMNKKAFQTYQAALRLNSWFLPAYMRIGYGYMEQKQYQNASAYFDKATKIALDSTEASLMKLKISALTTPGYPIESALNTFPTSSLISHAYLVRSLFTETRTLASYLGWIERGGYGHTSTPTHRAYYEWIMCTYELGNIESLKRALQAYEVAYPCLPAQVRAVLELVQAGGNPSPKLTEYRTYCGP